jgi:hypothetical protein
MIAQKLTDFQKRILHDLERAPNHQANWYEIAWNEFAQEWQTRKSRGAIIANIVKATRKLEDMGLVWISPPKHQYDAAIYSLRVKNWQQYIAETGGKE